MEVYAGFLEHTDHHVGRLIDALADLEILDDTLIYYIIGDNGASAEGTPNGCFNELIVFNGAAGLETVEFMSSRIDDFGTPAAYNHYAVGWAHAMDTPYQWTKQVASHWGGTRNGTIVHWPNGFAAKGEIRSQFHHVIDVATTILDAAGLPAPLSVNGVQQMPLHGVSMRPSFDDGGAAEQRTTQYFEMFCNRGIYHEGWTAVTRHSTPWVPTEMPAFDDDVWELYAPDDWTQAHDLAADQPDKLHDLQRLWLIEAGKYQVLPLDDRRFERFNAEMAGRPQLIRGHSQLLFAGMGRLSENSVIVTKNKSLSITASITVPEGGARGVLIAQGGAFGGFSLYLRPTAVRPTATTCSASSSSRCTAPKRSRQANTKCGPSSRTTAADSARAAMSPCSSTASKVGEGRVDATVPMLFSADETTDIGSDTATPVSDDYGPKDSEFTGRIHWVQLDGDEAADDVDHLISPEERLRIAMARQ